MLAAALVVSWIGLAGADNSSGPSTGDQKPPTEAAEAVPSKQSSDGDGLKPADVPAANGVYYVENGTVISTKPVQVGDVVRQLDRAADGSCSSPADFGLVMQHAPDVQYDASFTVDKTTCQVIITQVNESPAKPDPEAASGVSPAP